MANQQPDFAGEFCRKVKGWLDRGIGNRALTLPNGTPILRKVYAEPPDDAILETGPFPIAILCWDSCDAEQDQCAGTTRSRVYRIRGHLEYWLADPRKSTRLANCRKQLAILNGYLLQQRAYTGYGDSSVVISDSDTPRYSVSVAELNQRDITADGLIDFWALVVYNYTLA
jgi:hypothetical protein